MCLVDVSWIWALLFPGWYFGPSCILNLLFWLWGMHFLTGNHPCQTFSSNQDEFPRWKSSLPEIFIKSGWNFLLEIIPARAFCQTRMNFPLQMHPCQSFPLNQDACCYENKSVASNFREKDDLKDEYTAHSEMGKSIKYGRKSRCKRSTKDMRKGMQKNLKISKKVLDCLMEVLYNSTCVTGNKKCRDEIHNWSS